MKNSVLLISLVFVLLPFLYLASVYGGLPEQIPIHFDWKGNPDGWGPKYLLWFLPTVGIPLALLVIAAITRQMTNVAEQPKQRNIGMITLAFISTMICYIIYGAEAGSYAGLGGLSLLLGLFFGALGNYFPVLRQNAFVGIRIPPTMKSEEKWRKTHRFAGPLFLGGGALLVLNGLLLTGGKITVVMLIIIAAISIIPIIYAYRLPDDDQSDFV